MDGVFVKDTVHSWSMASRRPAIFYSYRILSVGLDTAAR